ncbi:MAG TPA: tetratricopeptide repeat protein [Candidatus Cybelea sp.]|nr:tetratricopeptide repeat protein [Candidatus Cybelea sp.]
MARDPGDRARQKSQKQLLAAVARHRAGQIGEAETLYRRALEQDPRNADALHLLGVIALERGRPKEAVELIGKAVQIAPNFAGGHGNLANALRAAGRTDEAMAHFARALSLQPGNPEFLSNLGAALLDQGRFAEAAERCRQAIALQPDMAEAHGNLGVALKATGALNEAEAPLRRAVALKPGLAFAQRALGDLLRESGRVSEAVATLRAAAQRIPASADLQHSLATALRGTGDVAGATASLREAVRLAPGSAQAWNDLGCMLRDQGRFEEAIESFRRALAIRPDFAEALRHLAGCQRPADVTGDVARLSELLALPDLPAEERIAADFALGKCLDDLDRFDDAFGRYAEGNALLRAAMAERGERFDPAALRRQVDRLIDTFTLDFFAARRAWGNASTRPAFILGMPRSGTSLVEQIAASHSQVFGAGELRDLGDIATRLGEAEGWTAEAIAGASAAHDARLASLGLGAPVVTDKMPDNVFMLGLIAALFPNARVVFCRRDPRDTCLSCYFQRFAKGNAFSYDLRDCGFRHFEVDRLIDHWRRVLPLKMLDVQYEALVAALEPESRRLIEFLGLPWEERCLEFHRTERVVSTASSWQVRQPLYDRSVGRWRNYERHLGPLLEGLSGSAVLDVSSR